MDTNNFVLYREVSLTQRVPVGVVRVIGTTWVQRFPSLYAGREG